MIAFPRSVGSTESVSFFGADDQHRARRAGADQVGGDPDAVAETGTRGVEVESHRAFDADPVGDLGGGIRNL